MSRPRHLTQRQRLFHRFVPLLSVFVLAVAAFSSVTFFRGGSIRPSTAPTAHPVRLHPTPTTTAPPPTTTTSTTLDPGTLPQTEAAPTSDDPGFQTRMAALWGAVVNDAPAGAASSFFPQSAYQQLKQLPNDTADYQERLLTDYDDDIEAAHALLGPDAASATLVSVNVPGQYEHWVPPGVCANDLGYFEVANSRIVYQEDGQTRSFGIASLISWRGEWYVVHLGAILRPSSAGVVEDPETGPGFSSASSTC